MHAERVKLEQQARACATDTWRCSEKCTSPGEEAQTESRTWATKAKIVMQCKAAMRPRNRANPAMQSPLAAIPKSVKKLSRKIGGNENADNISPGLRYRANNAPLQNEKILENLQHQIRGKEI